MEAAGMLSLWDVWLVREVLDSRSESLLSPKDRRVQVINGS